MTTSVTTTEEKERSTMTKPKLNLKLLRKVRDRIAEIPESYDQNKILGDNDASPCGSVACLLGEVIICSAPTVKQGIKSLRTIYTSKSVVDEAATLLGVSPEDASAMFLVGAIRWPREFPAQFRQAKTKHEEAKIAVAYLDECLRRKAVTW